MPFYYLGTMREVQWRMYRNWILNERSAVQARMRAIDAELRRIGRVTVFYERRTEVVQTASGAEREVDTITERRLGLSVSVGSSLEKLLQAYVIQGGNPNDVSLFLTPDDVVLGEVDPPENTEVDPNLFFNDRVAEGAPPDQPYYGVVSTQSTDSYGVGGRYRGGLPTFIRNPQNIIGRFVDLSDANSSIAIRADHFRRWTHQSLAEVNRIEDAIRKLSDLREQLTHERDILLKQAVGGSVPGLDAPDPNRFSRSMHVTRIVKEIDSVFYETLPDGSPDFNTIQTGTQEDPRGISNYDTLFGRIEGTDDYSSL